MADISTYNSVELAKLRAAMDAFRWRAGEGAPTDSTGYNGEYYLDTLNRNFYGPKAGGVWPAGSSLGLTQEETDVLYASATPVGYRYLTAAAENQDTTDMRATIQAALTAVSEDGGGTVELSPGTWLVITVDSPATGTKDAGAYGLEIPSNVNLVGQGDSTVIVIQAGGSFGAGCGISPLGMRTAASDYGAASNVRLENFKIISDDHAASSGILISFTHAQSWKVRGVTLGGCLYYGMKVRQCRNIVIENCHFTGSYSFSAAGAWILMHGIGGTSGPVSTVPTTQIIEDVRIEDCTSDARPDTDAGPYDIQLITARYQTLKNVNINRNKFNGRARNCYIIGSALSATADHVIDELNIENNEIVSNHVDSIPIYIFSDCAALHRAVRIRGNVIRGGGKWLVILGNQSSFSANANQADRHSLDCSDNTFILGPSVWTAGKQHSFIRVGCWTQAAVQRNRIIFTGDMPVGSGTSFNECIIVFNNICTDVQGNVVIWNGAKVPTGTTYGIVIRTLEVDNAGTTQAVVVRDNVTKFTGTSFDYGVLLQRGSTVPAASKTVWKGNSGSGTTLASRAVTATGAADGISISLLSSSATLAVGEVYDDSTAAGTHTLTLPLSPTKGAAVTLYNSDASWGTNAVTIGRNSSTIEGSASDISLASTSPSVDFVFDGTTWRVYKYVTAGHTHTLSEISDASANGRSLVAAADYAAQKTLLGLGSSDAVTHASLTISGGGAIPASGISWDSSSHLAFSHNSTIRMVLLSTGVTLGSAMAYGWSSAAIPSNITRDLTVYRHAANTHAWRNGAAAQEGQIYGTYTSDTNHERLILRGQTGGAFQIHTEKGSGGGTARDLELGVNGVTRMTFISAGTSVVIPANVLLSFNDTAGGIYGGGAGASHAISLRANLGLEIQGTGGAVGGPLRFISRARITPTATSEITIHDYAGTSRAALVASKIVQSPGASVTPASNGDLVFEATSNTQVTAKLKGSDGTVRSSILPMDVITVVAADYQAKAGEKIDSDTTLGAHTITLPAAPAAGTMVEIYNSSATWGTNNLTLGRNSQTIEGSAADYVISATANNVCVLYNGITWRVFISYAAPATPVDNAIARADGTSGALQKSDLLIGDADTGTQAAVGITNAHDGQTNSWMYITPLGTGGFYLGPRANGSADAGNARGNYAIDLQRRKSSASQVASGSDAFLGAGVNNAVSGNQAGCLAGVGNICNGTQSGAVASNGCSVGGQNAATIGGYGASASAQSAVAFGQFSHALRPYLLAHASNKFSVTGDAQCGSIPMLRLTADATPAEMSIGTTGAPSGSTITTATRFILQANSTVMADVYITARASSGDSACFQRRCLIKRDGSNNTVLVGSVQTIGTDIKDAGAAAWDATLTADDTNESLAVTVTGAAATTIRWTGRIEFNEVGYA